MESSNKRSRRNDVHRPGAIIPAHYSHVMSYSLNHSDGGHPMPSFNVNCAVEKQRRYRYEGLECTLDERASRQVTGGVVVDIRIHDSRSTVSQATVNRSTLTPVDEREYHSADGRCCAVALRMHAKVPFAATGGLGKCTVCGAHFVHGDIWVHELSGEHIHIGHDCADKYELLIDRSEYELELGRVQKAAAVACIRAERAEFRAAFLASHPTLEQALQTDHPIVRDIAGRFVQTCSLSEKQVALVLKLAAEAAAPKIEEAHVDAPEGRVTFIGELVSKKAHESDWGTTLKMTVKVREKAGTWLAWMTMPSSLAAENVERGARVEVTATLKRGRDAHFAIGKRPLAKVLPADASALAAGATR